MNTNELKPTAVVYETTDYDMFKRIKTNRTVTEVRVRKLAASFGERDILNPIIVNDKYEIIDGQGRYEARKRLGLPIQFIVVPGLDSLDCAQLNRFNTRWGMTDFVASWANNDDAKIAENYKRLMKCQKEVNLPYSIVLSIAGKGATGYRNKNYISEGDLKFTLKNEEACIRIAKHGRDILDALTYSNARIPESFWASVRIAMNNEKYEPGRMLNNCRNCRSSFNMMAALENQLKEFSRIYNFNMKTAAKKIYFEDYMRNRGWNRRSYNNSYVDIDNYAPDVSTLKEVTI